MGVFGQRRVTSILELSKGNRGKFRVYKEYMSSSRELDLNKVFSGISAVDVEVWDFYERVYRYSDVDFIRWQVENGVFDWKRFSDCLLEYAPYLFDADKFNWKQSSWAIIKYAPEYFDPDRFNWEDFSGFLVRFAPQLFDPDRFNWEKYSDYILEYAPGYFDPDRFNWRDFSLKVLEKAPGLFDPIRFNWDGCVVEFMKEYDLGKLIRLLVSGEFCSLDQVKR